MHDLSKHNGPPTKIAHLLSTHAQGINYNNMAVKGMHVTFMTARLSTTVSESALLLHIN